MGTAVILDVKLPLRQRRSLQLRAGGLVIRAEEILPYAAFAVVVDFQLSEDDHKHRAAKTVIEVILPSFFSDLSCTFFILLVQLKQVG